MNSGLLSPIFSNPGPGAGRERNVLAQSLAAMRARVADGAEGRYALIIANSKHPDARLNLPAVSRDAAALHALLTDPECGCFPAENVSLLSDELATTFNVRLELSRLRKRAGPAAQVWLIFLGHADIEEGEVYFLTHDAQLDNFSGTAFPGKFLAAELELFKTSRLVVVLDCCHAALFELLPAKKRSPLSHRDLLNKFDGSGRVILAAADRDERAGETDRGFLSLALEEGLGGAADADGDGVVTLEELWPFIAKRVPALGRQTPVLKGDHTAGFALTLNRSLVRRASEAAQRLDRAAAALRRWTGLDRAQLTTQEGRAVWELLNSGLDVRETADVTATALAEAVLGALDVEQCPAPVKALAHHHWANGPGGPRHELHLRLAALQEQLAAERLRRGGGESRPEPALRVRATLERPFVNSLGMKFVPAPGSALLFAVWVARVRDFRRFAASTGYDATKGMWSITPQGFIQRGDSWESPGFTQAEHCPVVGVSWDDAHAFCRWLTQHELDQGLIGPEWTYRLPSNQEWLAAAGPGRFVWGDQWPPPAGAGNFAGEEARDPAWPSDWGVIEGYRDPFPRTSPVGAFPPNRFGLHDMAGNVWQWIEDSYKKEMNSEEIRLRYPWLAEDGGGEAFAVLRGSSFYDRGEDSLLKSICYHRHPGDRYCFCGFRVVLAHTRAGWGSTVPGEPPVGAVSALEVAYHQAQGRAAASAAYRSAFERLHPMYQALRRDLHVSPEELRAAWNELCRQCGLSVVPATPGELEWCHGGAKVVEAFLPLRASKERPFVNNLGMRFVPVPGISALFSIWGTRVQDFRTFAAVTAFQAGDDMFGITSRGYEQRGETWDRPGFERDETHPVVGINWDEAQAFCEWLTQLERERGFIGRAWEYRLPKDAEWTAAAGPGKYVWGEAWPPPAGVGNFAGEELRDSEWPEKFGVIEGYRDGYPRTSPVGAFPASALGLYDMAGNVWEWVEDWYAKEMNSEELRQQPAYTWLSDDAGGRTYKALRGGSFDNHELETLAASYRLRISPKQRGVTCGFRTVLAPAPA